MSIKCNCFDCDRGIPNARHPVPGRDDAFWCWICAGMRPDADEIVAYANDVLNAAGERNVVSEIDEFVEQACWVGDHERCAASVLLGFSIARCFDERIARGLSKVESKRSFIQMLENRCAR